jgi:hypothetical protein
MPRATTLHTRITWQEGSDLGRSSLYGRFDEIIGSLRYAIFTTATWIVRTVVGATSKPHMSLWPLQRDVELHTSDMLRNSQTQNRKEWYHWRMSSVTVVNSNLQSAYFWQQHPIPELHDMKGLVRYDQVQMVAFGEIIKKLLYAIFTTATWIVRTVVSAASDYTWAYGHFRERMSYVRRTRCATAGRGITRNSATDTCHVSIVASSSIRKVHTFDSNTPYQNCTTRTDW